MDQTEVFSQILCRVKVRDHAKRRDAMSEANSFIKIIEDKRAAIVLVLQELVDTRHEDGLDLARGILMEIPDATMEFADKFIKLDSERWKLDNGRHHDNNDAVYVLLRTLGQAGTDQKRVLNLIWYCLNLGNPSVRDAALWALDDMGTDEAYEIVESKGLKDCSASVRNTASFILGDYETS